MFLFFFLSLSSSSCSCSSCSSRSSSSSSSSRSSSIKHNIPLVCRRVTAWATQPGIAPQTEMVVRRRDGCIDPPRHEPNWHVLSAHQTRPGSAAASPALLFRYPQRLAALSLPWTTWCLLGLGKPHCISLRFYIYPLPLPRNHCSYSLVPSSPAFNIYSAKLKFSKIYQAFDAATVYVVTWTICEYLMCNKKQTTQSTTVINHTTSDRNL